MMTASTAYLLQSFFLRARVRGSKRVSDFVQARPGLGTCSRRKPQRLTTVSLRFGFQCDWKCPLRGCAIRHCYAGKKQEFITPVGSADLLRGPRERHGCRDLGPKIFAARRQQFLDINFLQRLLPSE